MNVTSSKWAWNVPPASFFVTKRPRTAPRAPSGGAWCARDVNVQAPVCVTAGVDVDAKGAVQEQVYDVAWGDADKRALGADGKLPPVGSTVDVANASWTNTIGDPELITVWKDPSFDPKQRAFYYARVLEIPTPRWTAYDAKRFGIQPLPETTLTLQERAYTSPIWYTPGR
mgnify:CR=1 FL=1